MYLPAFVGLAISGASDWVGNHYISLLGILVIKDITIFNSVIYIVARWLYGQKNGNQFCGRFISGSSC